jgi:hypothetical protein
MAITRVNPRATLHVNDASLESSPLAVGDTIEISGLRFEALSLEA